MWKGLLEKLTIAYRKYTLQTLQLKALKEGKNAERLFEQKEVRKKLLTNLDILFTKNFIDNDSYKYAKYFNVLTSKAINKNKYDRAIRSLKNGKTPRHRYS